jgi:hypothetical protein
LSGRAFAVHRLIGKFTHSTAKTLHLMCVSLNSAQFMI